MSRGFNGALMRASGVGEWTFEVLAIDDLTPHYRRMRVRVPGFFAALGSTDQQIDLGPGSFVRLWVPDATDPDREHQRGYTIVDPDPETEEMTLEFVLHEPAGPASAWAQAAEVGSTVQGTRFGIQSFSPPTPKPAGYLLIGDPASLPAIRAIAASLPHDAPVEIILEQSHDEDLTLPVTDRADIRVTWVPRTPDSQALRNALVTTRTGADATPVAVAGWPGWYAWVAGEKTAVRAVRTHLKELGFPSSAMKAATYWALGKQMGKSRGEDQPAPATSPEQPAIIPVEATAARAGWAAAARRELMSPLRSTLRVAAAIQVIVSLLTLAPYVVLVELCRRMLDGRDDIAGLAWWALGLMGTGSTLALLLIVWLHVVDARFGHSVRRRMVDHLGRLPLGWFDARNSGQVRTAVQDDAAGMHYYVTHAVLDIVAAIVTPLTVLVYLFVVHAGLAAVLLIPLIVYYVIGLRMFAMAGDGRETFERHRDEIAQETIAFLDGAEVARVYDLGPDGRLHRSLDDRATFLHNWQGPLVGIKTTLDLVTRPTTSLLLIMGVGGSFVALGWMSPHDLVAFLLVGVTFGAQLLAVAYGAAALKESMDAAGRIGLVLAEPELDESPAGAAGAPATADTTVCFENVTFGYRPGHPVVRDINLTLEPGTVTALVGRSGAGKSTLATLLARFQDVDSGRVTIGGTDVRALPQPELYARVGFVFQHPTALRASVHDNIALGRPEATRAEVEQAARAAQLHERIAREPRGYDAILGEETWLSGGELQRLAIARTLLTDPPVLVLDEATASADPESEGAIQQAIASLTGGRTVLVIAHRLNTITDVDRIIVLDEGRIVADGTHADLTSRPGPYADLWQAFSAATATSEVTA
ncbi:MAG: ATP-binding cassette domain-containing protein [Aeromicrobium sp.]|uniref:ABC transporter ATP-binding protein/permease n=1 Tax=Aeromicrobium sp. TaxID=1871063 RepID=UPI0039E6722C